MNICNLLFNNTKNYVQLSNTIISLLLELNEIISSNDDNDLIFNILAQRVDNYKKTFTNMKDNEITNFIEPSKKSPKESNKRKMCVYKKNNKIAKKQWFQSEKKIKSCGFCNNIHHTASTCSTKFSIGQIIDGDLLVELLQDTCPFKVIRSHQCSNVYIDSLDFSKVQHLKCHQLLSKTTPFVNQRPDIDNLLVMVTCFEKYGIPIIGFTNVIFSLPLITSYIHEKKTTILFSSLSNESLGEECFCYKRKDNKQSSEVMLQETLLKVFSDLSNK